MNRAWAPAVTAREAAPLLTVAAANTLFILVSAFNSDAWTWGTFFEICTAVAAGSSVFFPVPFSVATNVFLTMSVYFADGPGLGIFTAFICTIVLTIERKEVVVVPISIWAWAALTWWSDKVLHVGDQLLGHVYLWAACIGTAVAIGLMARGRVERSTRSLREGLAEQRRGIARDLHDTVAHSMSLIVMCAERANLRGETTPEDLRFITSTAERSIREIRAMMELLRGRAEPAGLSGDIMVAPPMPEVLAAAQKELESHGFRPAITVEGDLSSLPPSVSAALAKTVQEGTNNIVKHAEPGSSCGLMLEIDGEEAELLMTNVPLSAVPTTPSVHAPLGLDGMRERILALGGEFSAGRGSARWITRVRLPLT